MNPELNIYEEKMGKTLSVLSADLGTIRASNANPAVLDKIEIDYYGTPTKVNQMASITVSEARILTISPYDKSTLKSIEKAIQTSDIGINPQNDGAFIRLVFPQLTGERRQELAKQISKQGEDSKVAIRSIRRDAMEKFKAMKKNNELTEDDQKNLEDELQKLTDKYIKKIEDTIKAKQDEIMEV